MYHGISHLILPSNSAIRQGALKITPDNTHSRPTSDKLPQSASYYTLATDKKSAPKAPHWAKTHDLQQHIANKSQSPQDNK
jgi:hypothetical protein